MRFPAASMTLRLLWALLFFFHVNLLAATPGKAVSPLKPFNEALEERLATKGGRIEVNISDLVSTYLPVGTPQQETWSFCKAHGFNVHPLPRERLSKKEILENMQVTICSKKFKRGKGWSPQFTEFRIVLRSKNDILQAVEGYIFVHTT